MKNVFPTIVTEHQLVFAKDRLISDNIIIAFETLHYMKIKNFGNMGFIALKLDISKVYDRVKWVFLGLMRKIGFNEQWIGQIMICVRSVTYSILINGDHKD